MGVLPVNRVDSQPPKTAVTAPIIKSNHKMRRPSVARAIKNAPKTPISAHKSHTSQPTCPGDMLRYESIIIDFVSPQAN